ncbi:flagellar export protein FliJ [Methylovorus sp. MM2]|uniref:flagellar export protein FliJ n=1 Tax=Methylovorus sp. MM2 TaxID=1848038 RepID=UPI0007E25764|nr:flagellar export protein FliJ [Methylovorus sp. MM2]OAM51261.1 flagellar export protein FliJ [Methylovorus sp. MM2]
MATQQSVVLTTLKEIASKEVDAAAEKLAAANQLLKDANSKLDMLNEYRGDYVKKLDGILVSGFSADAYQNYQSFLRKLDQAILGQQDVVDSSRYQVNAQREIWQECQKKKLSYEVLADRSDKRAHQQQLKQDQKMMDEHAMRMNKFNR